MLAVLTIVGFMSAAALITGITWKGRNKSSLELIMRGMLVLFIGGFMGLFWSSALEYPSTGPVSGLFILVGYLGHLLSMYTAVLASALIRTAWSEGHTPVSKDK